MSDERDEDRSEPVAPHGINSDDDKRAADEEDDGPVDESAS